MNKKKNEKKIGWILNAGRFRSGGFKTRMDFDCIPKSLKLFFY